MPYRNIVWVKLEKRLIHDHRFYLMSEESQLIYLKLLMIAADTNNKIPKSTSVLLDMCRSKLTPKRFEECIKEIKDNFPKFRDYGKMYKFLEFMDKHNRITPGTPQGTPGDSVDKKRIDTIRNKYISIKHYNIKHFKYDDYSRTAKAIKMLISKANDNDKLVLDALEWMASKGWEWTLETVIKKWPDFMKEWGSKDDFDRRYQK